MSKIRELKEQRAAAHAKAVEFLKVTPQTVESRAGFDAAMADVDALGVDVERIERAEKAEKELAAKTGIDVVATTPLDPSADPAKRGEYLKSLSKRYHKAWMDALRNGATSDSANNRWRGMSDESMKTFQEVRQVAKEEAEIAGKGNAFRSASNVDDPSARAIESRDQSEGTLLSQIGTYTGLGFFIPAGFVYQIEQATKYYAPLLDGGVFQIMETATGQPLPYPTSDDTTQKAVLVGENVAVAEQDATAGHINFGAWKYTSGLVRVSFELLQDSAFDLEKWLANLFGIRWARGMETDLTTGSGSSKPTGLLTAIAASGATAVTAAGSAESTGGSQTGQNSIGISDMIALEHSVDPTYRKNARYMLHDKTMAEFKKVLDKFGRPLWTPSVREGDPDRINGYPYVINQAMSTIAAGNTTVAFGDMSKFLVRKVKDLSILRLTERYADFGQVAFVSFARIDSNLLDAGTHPCNVLIQHA